MPHPQVLRDMALFVEVAKRKSFSRAAEILGIPISSLSRRIALFESALGLRLLDRTTRKLVLTAYGEAYYALAARLVEEAQRSFDDLVSEANRPTGLLRIAVPPDRWVVRAVSELVAEFARGYPQVRVHIDIKPTAEHIAGGYDLAIETEMPKETSLIVRKVVELENGLFAAPGYLQAHGVPDRPQELTAHRVVSSGVAAGATWILHSDRETAKVTVGGPVSSNSPSLARRLGIAGQGIAMASLINVESDVRTGRLIRVLPYWRLPATPVFIVTTSRLLPARTRGFIELAARHLPMLLASDKAGAPHDRNQTVRLRSTAD